MSRKTTIDKAPDRVVTYPVPIYEIFRPKLLVRRAHQKEQFWSSYELESKPHLRTLTVSRFLTALTL